MQTSLSMDSLVLLCLCSDMVKRSTKILSFNQYQQLELKVRRCRVKRPMHLLNTSSEQMMKYLKISSEEANQIMDLFDDLVLILRTVAFYEKQNIHITTIYEENYPITLHQRLNKNAPLILYFTGNYDLLKQPLIGVSGPIQSSETIKRNTEDVINKINEENYHLISSGNRGCEDESIDSHLSAGGCVVLVICHQLIKLKKKYQSYLKQSTMLIISHRPPNANFEVVEAILRNSYIYGLSYLNIVMYSQYNSGAVWFSAIQNLKYKWSQILAVIDDEFYGNARLVEAGALPITMEQIRSELLISELIEMSNQHLIETENELQLSIFEFIEEDERRNEIELFNG